jgi:hypothetical protein
MKLWGHFLGFIVTIVIIHFIFIDIQHLLHPTSSTAQILPGQLSKLQVRTKDSAVEDQSLLLNQINQTLTQLKSDLLHAKRLRNVKDEVQSAVRKEASEMTSISEEIAVTRENTDALRAPSSNKKAVIFTMDCITSYEESSRSGGAAGELIIRHALEDAFKHYNIPLRIVRSDDEFSKCNMGDFDIILLDSWTWAAKGEVVSSFG